MSAARFIGRRQRLDARRLRVDLAEAIKPCGRAKRESLGGIVAVLLEVLLEDNHCLAVAKPAPLLTQAPSGVPSLEALAKAYLKERYHKKGNVYLGIPHRLDRPVSGVVLFARSTKAAQRLAEQFQGRQVRKIYWALVERSAAGDLPPKEGTWEDWLRKVKEEARSERATPDAPEARRAVLHFRRLHERADDALLEIEPQTGRMHQIRVQAAARGWPVRGDVLYGSRWLFGLPAELPRDRIIALHGRSLTFLHPIRYEPLTVTAPLPETWWQSFPTEPGA
jgi:23S rRNA pseudouridine1911/1915/1917 synthase